jgi:Zn-dependent protease
LLPGLAQPLRRVLANGNQLVSLAIDDAPLVCLDFWCRAGSVFETSAESGLASFIAFLALVSVSLGVLNLLPVPLLDGGHLMFYAAEALRGRPLPAKAQEMGYRAGFALLITQPQHSIIETIGTLFSIGIAFVRKRRVANV